MAARLAVVGLSMAGALVLGVLFGLAETPVAAQTQAERDLSAARAALQRIGAELSEAESAAEAAEGALERAADRLGEIEAIVNEVARQVELQRVAVRDAEARLAALEEELAALERVAADRITRLFKQGPQLTFETLLNASGADEVLARTELLQRVVVGDQVDLERLDALSVAADAQRAAVTRAHADLQEYLTEQEEVLEEAERLRASRALAAADARQRAQALAGERDDLEAEEGQLAALVERQQAEERRRQQAAQQRAAAQRAAASATPAAGRGGYAWPMCAPVTSEYGPRWGRMHRGIDLGARTGTPIRAIRGGRVIFAGWQGGYGQLTLIDHGNGVVSAYAHQSRFAVGQGAQVAQGQVIGYVGTTGNTTGPHLHLETRVNGTAVNPRQYLSGRPC